MILRLLALLLLLPSLSLAQSGPPPIRTLRVNGSAISPQWPTLDFTGSGITATSDPTGRRTILNFAGGGGGGGTGVASSVQILGSDPSTPATGDVWYSSLLGTFRARWTSVTDSIPRASQVWRREFFVTEFGAKGDWNPGTASGTDDTAAIQAAINTAIAAGGGVVVIPPTHADGTRANFRWRGGVTLTPPGEYGDFTIDARGARIWIDPTADHTVALAVSQAKSFTWRGGEVFGWRGDYPPTVPSHSMANLILATSTAALVEDLTVHALILDSGAGTPATAAGIAGDNLTLRRVNLEALANTGQAPDVRAIKGWVTFTTDHLNLQDFYTYAGHNPSILQGSGMGIVLGRPDNSTRSAVYGSNTARILDTRVDEGSGRIIAGVDVQTTTTASYTQPAAYPATVTVAVADSSWALLLETVTIAGGGTYVVSAIPDATHLTLYLYPATSGNAGTGATVGAGAVVDGTHIQSLEIDGLSLNVNPTVGSVGLDLRSVRFASVRNWWVREGNTGSVALKARNCDVVTVERSTTKYDASALSGIDVNSTVGLLHLVDSHLDAQSSTARQTIVDGGGGTSLQSYSTGARPLASSVPQGRVILDTDLQTTCVRGSDVTWHCSGAGGGGGGQVATPESCIDWALRQQAMGYTLPDGFPGQFTVGTAYNCTSACNHVGARFYWQHGTAENVRISLWRQNGAPSGGYTRLELIDKPVTGAGIYSVAWANGGGVGGAWVAEDNRRYLVTMRGSVSGYLTVANITPALPAGVYPPQPTNWGNPLVFKPGVNIENWYVATGAQTDTAPPETASWGVANTCSLVEPVVTIN